jgi:hypothetical protein
MKTIFTDKQRDKFLGAGLFYDHTMERMSQRKDRYVINQILIEIN